MNQPTTIARTAALLADESRMTMLLTLLDGRAYTAKELAMAANVTPQTTSFHLDKLLSANFLQAVNQGRHRYFRLANQEVAQSLEAMLSLHHGAIPRQIDSSCPEHLRGARVCYDHLAGALGTGLHRAMTARGWVIVRDKLLVATPEAHDFLAELGIDPETGPLTAKPCLDWSERDFHLAGHLGRHLFEGMLDKRWILRGKPRQVLVTQEGKLRLSTWGFEAAIRMGNHVKGA